MVTRDMCSLAQEVIKWSELHMVLITVRYITAKKNILADQLSHPGQVLPTEWSLFSGCSRICATYLAFPT